MEQEIRFCATSAGRIAYAVTGGGPALVLPAWWLSHQEALWEDRAFRAFVTALAERHAVIRYDRIGTGLSDRTPRSPLALAEEVELLGSCWTTRHSNAARCSASPPAGRSRAPTPPPGRSACSG